MDTNVIAALVAATVSIVLAVFNFIQTNIQRKRLEILKHNLAKEKSEKDARIDYEYEAKKRLYKEYEPLFFQFTEYAILALNHIKGISWTAFEGKTTSQYWDKSSWMNRDSYYFKETVYKLFCPFAAYKLIQEKFTTADISIDQKLFIQYYLCRILYFTFQQDYIIAEKMSKKILIEEEHRKIFELPNGLEASYSEVYSNEWRKYKINPKDFKGREGLRTGEIDNIIQAFLQEQNNERKVIIDFGEFEERLNIVTGPNNPFEILVARLRCFDPKINKVLWRILVVQYCIYYIFQKIRFKTEVSFSIVEALCAEFFTRSRDDLEKNDKAGFKANIDDKNEQEDVLNSAEEYLLYNLKRHLIEISKT